MVRGFCHFIPRTLGEGACNAITIKDSLSRSWTSSGNQASAKAEHVQAWGVDDLFFFLSHVQVAGRAYLTRPEAAEVYHYQLGRY